MKSRDLAKLDRRQASGFVKYYYIPSIPPLLTKHFLGAGVKPGGGKLQLHQS